MRKQILYIAFLFLFALPVMAEQAIVSVSAGSTRTFTDSDLPDAIRTNAENQGLTFLGWTTSPIADGAKPATYYGTQATVTPATATTYYAFFARRTNSGSRIVRKITTPSDVDTIMLVISVPAYSMHFYVPNGGTSIIKNIQLNNISSGISDDLYNGAVSDASAWKYLVYNADTFQLKTANYRVENEYYLYVKDNNTNIGPLGDASPLSRCYFLMKNGHPYNVYANKNIYFKLESYKYYWRPLDKSDYTTTFSFYRYEWYSDFVTDITDPCPECFMYIAE